jgi:hypothetical protein
MQAAVALRPESGHDHEPGRLFAVGAYSATPSPVIAGVFYSGRVTRAAMSISASP